jgi:hypothetical protein
MRGISRTTVAALLVALVAGIGTLGPAQAAGHQVVPGPSSEPNPSGFATQDQGCLGPLRSEIAQGQFAGVGPFGQHFTGSVDPGSHYGSVGEATFLSTVLGIPSSDVSTFCSQFTTK